MSEREPRRIEVDSTAGLRYAKEMDGEHAKLQIDNEWYDYEVIDETTLEITWFGRIGPND